MHGDVAVLFAETLVFVVGVWIAFDSEAGAVDVVFFWGFSSEVVEVDWFRRDWDLSNDSYESLRSALHSCVTNEVEIDVIQQCH